jgi:hypothetical protein
MNNKEIIGLVSLIVVAVLIIFSVGGTEKMENSFVEEAKIVESNEYKRIEWEKFKDEEIGVEFNFPKGYKPFVSKTIGFQECRDCMTVLSVSKEVAYSDDVREELINRNRTNIIQETVIDGYPAIVTAPYDSEVVKPGDKRVSIIKDGFLISIYYRDADPHTFWENVKFLP